MIHSSCCCLVLVISGRGCICSCCLSCRAVSWLICSSLQAPVSNSHCVKFVLTLASASQVNCSISLFISSTLATFMRSAHWSTIRIRTNNVVDRKSTCLSARICASVSSASCIPSAHRGSLSLVRGLSVPRRRLEQSASRAPVPVPPGRPRPRQFGRQS